MLPLGTRSVFRSRWTAIVWAIGIIIVAWEVAGPDLEASNTTTVNAEQPTDATGDPITADDQQRLAAALNSF